MILYLVVPCYNEEAVLEETAKRLKEKMTFLEEKNVISNKSRVMFVDDGSHDNTWKIITKFVTQDSMFCGVKLSHNQGHQYALLAGLMTAKNYAHCTISIDADLQDDLDAIDKFVEKYESGCEIVYGVRTQRKTDTVFKRTTAQWYYKILKKLGVEVIYNHADFRLMSRRALDELEKYEESNLFLRGIVPQIGLKWDIVEYERHERFAGESKYPLKKMLSLAFDGITSFSSKPIMFITLFGLVLTSISVLFLTLLIILLINSYSNLFLWLLASILLMSGIQLGALGIVGQYIGKIYREVKHRPRYIIETIKMREE